MNKTIAITGGSGGLGKRLVRLFSNNKDNICSLSRSNKDGLSNHFFCDVTDEASVNSAISDVAKKYGSIDMLICNSGIGLAGGIESTPTDMVKSVFDVNFYGTLYTVKAALKYMKSGSRIIAISSASAFFPLPYRSIYSASKSALNMMMFGLNMELSAEGIKVCSVCPGEINTEFVKNRLWYNANDKSKKNLENISKNFHKKQNSRMNADNVADIIFKISNKKHIKPVYIIGLKYKIFYFISKILPSRLFLSIISKKYGGK